MTSGWLQSLSEKSHPSWIIPVSDYTWWCWSGSQRIVVWPNPQKVQKVIAVIFNHLQFSISLFVFVKRWSMSGVDFKWIIWHRYMFSRKLFLEYLARVWLYILPKLLKNVCIIGWKYCPCIAVPYALKYQPCWKLICRRIFSSKISSSSSSSPSSSSFSPSSSFFIFFFLLLLLLHILLPSYSSPSSY